MRDLALVWESGGSAAARNIRGAARAIEEYLGGPGVAKRNKAGDMVIVRSNKKIRFDIKNPGRVSRKNPSREKPHFHVQERNGQGEWVDVTKNHRNYFKKD